MHGAGARVLTCLALRSRPRLSELWMPVNACIGGKGGPLVLQPEGCAFHLSVVHAYHDVTCAATS